MSGMTRSIDTDADGFTDELFEDEEEEEEEDDDVEEEEEEELVKVVTF